MCQNNLVGLYEKNFNGNEQLVVKSNLQVLTEYFETRNFCLFIYII